MRTLFLLCMMIVAQTTFAQSFDKKMNEIQTEKIRVIDSLKLILEKDPINHSVMMKIVKEYMSIDKDSLALYYVDQLLQNSQEKDIDEIAEYRLIKSDLLFRLKDPEAGVALLNENLKEDLNEKSKIKTYRVLSEYYQSKGDFEKSLELTKKTEEFYLEKKDSIGLFPVYCSIAAIYINLNRKKEAVNYFDKARLLGKNETPYNKVAVLINLSILLNDQGSYDSAIERMNEAKEIADANDIFEIYPIIYKSLGIIYHQKAEYKKSNEYLLQTIELAKKSNLPENQLISLYNYLGQNYYYLKKYREAVFYMEKANELDKSNLIVREWHAEIAQYPLIDAYLKLGNNKKAFQKLKEFTQIKTAFFEEEQASKLNAAVEKYENDKKEIEIEQLNLKNESQQAQLKSQRRIIYLAIVLLIILILLGFTLFKIRSNRRKLRRTKQSLDNAVLKQRFLRMQLNPHFLFHSLSSVESYIYRGKKEEAAEFLQDFSRLMRTILESSDIDFIGLNEEISFIEKYIKLQQLVYDEKFDYQIQVDENIDADQSLIPPMFIQPFVENAILHGALSAEKGWISIEIKKESDDQMVIYISDNGLQKDETAVNSKKMFRSMSTSIIQQRIENLKNTFNYHMSYSVKSRREISNTEGTQIVLTVPIIQKNQEVTS